MQFRASLVWYISRAFLGLDYALTVVQRVVALIQHEILWRISCDQTRFQTNQRLYTAEKEYFPSTDFFNQGLFDWENALLNHATFPKQGRLLLLAAGAGREAQALCKSGYDLLCFEPNTSFYNAAKIHFAAQPQVEWCRASFVDLVERLDSVDIPAELSKPFDAIWIGWGAFSYLHDHVVQRQLLTMLHKQYPKAPVVLSFLMQPPSDGLGTNIRRRLPAAIGPSKVFFRRSGFTYLYTKDQVATLAQQSGYEPVLFQTNPYPHVLLTPRS